MLETGITGSFKFLELSLAEAYRDKDCYARANFELSTEDLGGFSKSTSLVEECRLEEDWSFARLIKEQPIYLNVDQASLPIYQYTT